MPAQISTAVSDLVLAVTAFWLAIHTFDTSLCFAFGIGLQGLAASAGVVKFGQSRPSGFLVQTHKFLSWLTTVLGLTLMSSGHHFNVGNFRLAQGLILAAFMFTLCGQFLKADSKTLLTKALSGLSLLSLLCLLLFRVDYWGVTACLLYIVSGSAIGVEGQLNGIPRVDILHYGLALGNMGFYYSRI